MWYPGLTNISKIKWLFENETLNYDTLKESVASIVIYYDDLSYTLISQDPKMEAVDLIAAIGGTLGLFLGVDKLFLYCLLI